MHQHPRASPKPASPANSPRTHPSTANNPREPETGESATGSDRGTPSEQISNLGEGSDAIMRTPETSSHAKEQLGKLSQVIQNYFTKAALIILHARVALPPAFSKDSRTRRINKWFNVEIDETDLTRDDVRLWRNCGAIANRPPPMVIETFIDTRELTNSQSLVVIDEQGRRWDVEEALTKSPSSFTVARDKSVRPEVTVERWVVRLGEAPKDIPQDLKTVLPHTYKNSVVLFRSLYACARLLPAWRFGKRLFKDRSTTKTPKLKFRILQGPDFMEGSGIDNLATPLFDHDDSVPEKFSFDPINSPAGTLSIDVTYRSHCDIRVDDSEAFLSSRFLGMDEDYFEPSLGRKRESDSHGKRFPVGATVEAGSLPQTKRDNAVQPDPGQAYGSLSTFHQMGPPTGTSPLSALRAARVAGSESPEDPTPRRAPPNTRSAQGSRSSLRSTDSAPGVGRRPSVSFMPFKSPSLSASPSQTEQSATNAPRGSLGKNSPLAALAEARAPSNLSPYGSVPSRGSPSILDPINPHSATGSPKPGPPTRYSSSFGHRKSKLSTDGSSRTEDDNSSGKASLSSSNAQPGSGVFAEGGGGSSGSIQTDDDNISEFLKMLDQKKDLKSFRPTTDQAASVASTKRTSAALSKFQKMKDSNDALSNSMYSSLHVHRSSSSSSRQLSSVPPMIAGTSQSTSSSPGKPISPHTPHTPSIPSRLSANSTIEYSHRSSTHADDRPSRPAGTDDIQSLRSNRDRSTGAIYIPNSPRPYQPDYRRSSSVAQPRAQYEEDDIFPFAMRSASLGVDDRPPLSLSALAGLQDAESHESAVAVPSVEDREPPFETLFNPSHRSQAAMGHKRSSSLERQEAGPSVPTRGVYRPRISRGSGRGGTPPQGSSSSLVERGSGSGGSSDHRGGRFSYPRPSSTFEEEEPLLFAMSDFDATQQSRRSLEEARGSKGSYERSGGDSGASSRRGSRRGGY
ncbi:autophagy protein 13 [Lecanora helva]